MKIAVFGGSFNPPHLGHESAVRAVMERCGPDRLLVIPNSLPPHKQLPRGGPDPEGRLCLARAAFAGIPRVQVSDIEQRRGGVSYTCDTIAQLKRENPGAELSLMMGADMLLSLEKWCGFAYLMEHTVLLVFSRSDGEQEPVANKARVLQERCNARIRLLEKPVIDISSTRIREMLKRRKGREYLNPDVYSYIIKSMMYNARPDFNWLRERAYAGAGPDRAAHIKGCEAEAVRLSRRWGANPEQALEAAILHDITKKLSKDEQLLLCKKYDIITDSADLESPKLLHAKTGAALSRNEFGADDEVYGAIRWHTTGRPRMTLLEKVIYLADCIEPNRSFPGVEQLRELAYVDLDRAVTRGLEMSVERLNRASAAVHKDTILALEFFWARRER